MKKGLCIAAIILSVVIVIVIVNVVNNENVSIQKGHLIMKRININREYDKLREYCEYIYEEADEYDDDYYLFDKETYKFVHCSKVDLKNTERFINVPKFDTCYSMIDFYIQLSGNNQEIKNYIYSTDDIEEICVRMRKFWDYNGFENYNDNGYDEYLVFTEMFVKWCNENDIQYSFKLKKPPKGYSELEQHKDNFKWEIPTN